MPQRILIAWDDDESRLLTGRLLEARGHTVLALSPRAEWLADLLRSSVDLLLIDRGPELDRIRALLVRDPTTSPSLLVRGDSSEATPAGTPSGTPSPSPPSLHGAELAIDVWLPPDAGPERVVEAAEMALRTRQLRLENARLRRELASSFHRDRIVGSSTAATRLRAEVEQLARLDHPVALVGERGSGRRQLARVLHHASLRAGGPYLEYPCDVQPPETVAADLFGRETATRRHTAGWIERTHGGTFHLLAAGRLPLPVQDALADLVREGRLRPEGRSVPPLEVEIRLVASFDRDPDVEVGQGWLGASLRRAFGPTILRVPPLRERPEDIPLLARLHLAASGLPELEISEDALRWLEQRPWRGNVAELYCALDRAVERRSDPSSLSAPDFAPESADGPGSAAPGSPGEGPEIAAPGPPGEGSGTAAPGPPGEGSGTAAPGPPGELEGAPRWTSPPPIALPPEGVDLALVERDLIEQALARTAGNQTQAARLLGLSRQTLIYRMQKHGIR